MSRARRTITALAWGLGLLVVALLATLAAARLHLELPVGRRAVGDSLEQLVSSAIRGTLHVGQVEDASLDRVVARDVEFRHEDGEVELRLDHIVLEPDLGRLLRDRRIATRSIRVDGALLRMREGRDGLRLERALESPGPDDGGSPTYFLELAGLHFERLQTFWALEGPPTFRIDDVSGFGHLSTDERGNVVMRFDRLAGELRTTGLPIEISAGVRRASGRVHAGWDRMGSFDIELEVAGSPLDLELDLFDREGGLQVRASADAEGPSLAALAALGIELGNDVGGTERTGGREAK